MFWNPTLVSQTRRKLEGCCGAFTLPSLLCYHLKSTVPHPSSISTSVLEEKSWAVWVQKVDLICNLLTQLRPSPLHWFSYHGGLPDNRETFFSPNEPGFHPKVIPQLCWRCQLSSHFAISAGRMSAWALQLWVSIVLSSPHRYWDRAQQAAGAGGFHLSLWRTNDKKKKALKFLN